MKITSVRWDPDNRLVWVSYMENSVVYAYSPIGNIVKRIDTGLSSPLCLMAIKGDIWLGDYHSPTLAIYKNGETIKHSLALLLAMADIPDALSCRVLRVIPTESSIALLIFRPCWRRFLVVLDPVTLIIRQVFSKLTMNRFVTACHWQGKYVLANFRPGALFLFDPEIKHQYSFSSGFSPDDVMDIALNGDDLFVLCPGCLTKYNMLFGERIFHIANERLPVDQAARIDVGLLAGQRRLWVAGETRITAYLV